MRPLWHTPRLPGATALRRRGVGRVPHRSGPASRRRDNRRTRASRHL